MRHEKVIKREDGSRVKIDVDFREDHSDVTYGINVLTSSKGKRKFRETVNSDDWDRRSLDMDKRPAHDMKIYLKHVTAEEIQSAKLELWEKLKP